MPTYFSKFPKTYYTFGADGSGLDIVTNIISRFTIEESLKKNSSVYYNYLIQDGDTPENLAAKYYDSSERHWIILMMNDIVDPQFDWPLQYQNLMGYIDSKYQENPNSFVPGNGLNFARSNIKSYYKIFKEQTSLYTNETLIEVDEDSYSNSDFMQTDVSYSVVLENGTTLTSSFDASTKTFYEYEEEENEKKRNIILLKKEFVQPLQRELERVFSE